MNDTGSETIRILVVDDHFVARLGLSGLLSDQPDMEVVGEAENGARAVSLYQELKPDLVLTDLRMPEFDGVQATRAIRETDANARILVVSSYDTEADIVPVFDAGARGYLTKEAKPERLLDAVRTVARGERYVPENLRAQLDAAGPAPDLGPRDMQLLELIAEGLPNREIATRLSLTPGTVRIYVSKLLARMGVASRAEAVSTALRRGTLRRK